MIVNFLLIIVGFVALIFGAEWLVNGASGLAKKYHISDMIIGLTIVAFGTSAPELVVNSLASFTGHPEIVFGNVIGSNIFNTFLILGTVAMIYPISVNKGMIKREIPFSLLIVFLIMILSNAVLGQTNSVLTQWEAVFIFVVFAGFLAYTFVQAKKGAIEEEEIQEGLPTKMFKILGLIIFGLLLLVVGGDVVVKNAIKLAQTFGVSEKVIALTIVAAGTSLPELVTSVVAAGKKKSDIAIGNVIGSNIFNLLLILSVSGMVSPIVFDTAFNVELLLLAIGTLLILLFMWLGTKKQIDRWQGLILFLMMVGYTIYLFQRENISL